MLLESLDGQALVLGCTGDQPGIWVHWHKPGAESAVMGLVSGSVWVDLDPRYTGANQTLLSPWNQSSIGMGWDPGFLRGWDNVGSLEPWFSVACLEVGSLGDSLVLEQAGSLYP